jgi:16S rRNA (adenine1518-N6/adenine1519-N6)-dimethyltransferase
VVTPRVRARKRFGQHFLEPAWADRLVAAIGARATDRVLEIGPGPGALTLRLAPLVERLTAVEVDRDLASALEPRLPPNVTLVVGDVLTYDLSPLLREGPLRVVGNLPYNISSPVLFRLLDESRRQRGAAAEDGRGPLVDATLMLQREVADRIEAPPGTRDYGVLSILVQLHADVQRVLTLPPGAFRPPPAVRSAVVRLTFRAPRVALRNEALFEAMVRAMFTQRRKTLGNALASFAGARQAEPRAVLAQAGIDPGRRAETLTLPELARLADCFAAPAG